MSDYEPTTPHPIHTDGPVSGRSLLPEAPTDTAGGGLLPPAVPSPDTSSPVTKTGQPLPNRVRRWLSNRRTRRIVAVVMVPVIGLSAGLATSHLASAAQANSGIAPP